MSLAGSPGRRAAVLITIIVIINSIITMTSITSHHCYCYY